MTRWLSGVTGRGAPASTATSPRSWLRSLAVALLATAFAGVAHAQSGDVAGTVTTTGVAEPIAGARVTVVGTRLGAITDDAGRFRIASVSGTTVTLEVRRIGYQVARVQARVGQTDVAIQLVTSAVSLEQVVVTGTVGASQKRELGNSVTQIDASKVTAVAPIQDMQQLINGRAPGVVVMPASGAVGTGSQVRVRGIASFSLSNSPLLYVDGVRVNNNPATGPQNQSFGSSTISRLNDINPEDIQSIEILKGPSAATLYGTEASNGVINIITKRGTTGAARWNAVVKQGVNYLQNWKTRFPTNYGIPKVGPDSGQVVAVSMDSLVAANKGDLFRDGRYQESELSVSGGSSLFNYYASGNLLDSQGAEPSNNTRKYNGRVNIGINPSTKFHVSTDMGYITGPTYLSAEAGYGGRVWSTLLATPTTYGSTAKPSWQHGFYSGLPYQYDLQYKLWQDLDRFTASVKFDHEPTTWLQHRLTLGIDRTNTGDNYLYPRIDSLNQYSSFSGDALGYRELDQTTTTYRSIDYAASATWSPTSSLRTTSSAGAQYYHDATNAIDAWGSVFPFQGLTTVNATTTGKGQAQDYFDDATLGYYGQEELAWRDRLYLTAALRWDNSSAFGQNVNKVVYPKYSASYVMSEESFWQNNPWLSRVSSFRVRAAYGEAGKAPGTYDALRTFSPVSGPGDSPAITPLSIGNPNLGPERGKEYELGFDASALGDRVSYELTYYHKKTTDAILFAQLPPSIGFSGTAPINAGGILNTGWEQSLRITPYRGDRLDWDLNFNYATNDNKVLSLLNGQSFVSAGTYLRHAVGYPAFGWWERQLVSAQVDAKGVGIPSTMMCNDGKGGSTPCYDGSGKLVAPLVYLGRSVPPREGSISTTLTFLKNFSVYTQFDFKNGQKKLDGNTRVRCTFFGGRCPENFPTKFDPATLNSVRQAEINSNRQFVDFLITSASFTKWRELTFAYNLPDRYAHLAHATHAAINLSGRNLHTFTGYQGFEPEAMFLGGSRGGNAAWEQTTLPQLTSWILGVNLGF